MQLEEMVADSRISLECLGATTETLPIDDLAPFDYAERTRLLLADVEFNELCRRYQALCVELMVLQRQSGVSINIQPVAQHSLPTISIPCF